MTPHLALLVLVLGGLALLVPLDQPWSADDGAYHHAVRLVRDDGRWHEERPELDLVDHPGRYPLALSEVDEAGRAYPYVKHPAWILVLVATTSVFGDLWGLVVPGLVAVVAAAALAWRLGRRLDVSSAPLAFWLVALGPLAITAFGYWAHAVVAALGGVAALLICRLARRPSPATAALLGGVGGAMVMMRSEGVLFVAALVAALVVVCLVGRGPARRWVDPLIVLALPAATYIAEKAWVASLVEGQLMSTELADPPIDRVEGRLSGAWHTFGAHTPGSIGTQVILWAATGLVVAGLVTWVRRPGLVPRASVATGVALTLLLVGSGSVGLVSGMVPAWPGAVAGLALVVVRRDGLGSDGRALVVLGGTYAALVLATQYPSGGGIDWGGRFLAPVAVPLAVLAALGLAGATSAMPGRGRDLRGLTAAVVVSAAAILLAGMVATDDVRGEVATVLADVDRASPDVAVAAQGSFLPRYDVTTASPAWVRADEGGLDVAVERAFSDGAGRVAVVGGMASEVAVPGTTQMVVSPTVVLFVRAP